LTTFINHLLSKAGVKAALCHMYSPKKLVKSKVGKGQGESQYLYKRQGEEEDDIVGAAKHNSKIRRTKLFSEDRNEPDGKADTGSNSSLVISTSAIGPEVRRRHERVLHCISEEAEGGLILSYIIKPLPEDGMIIYEVACRDRQIRVSVHEYQSILKGFPKALVINYNTLTAP